VNQKHKTFQEKDKFTWYHEIHVEIIVLSIIRKNIPNRKRKGYAKPSAPFPQKPKYSNESSNPIRKCFGKLVNDGSYLSN
jgi:hypothetical protein